MSTIKLEEGTSRKANRGVHRRFENEQPIPHRMIHAAPNSKKWDRNLTKAGWVLNTNLPKTGAVWLPPGSKNATLS